MYEMTYNTVFVEVCVTSPRLFLAQNLDGLAVVDLRHIQDHHGNGTCSRTAVW